MENDLQIAIEDGLRRNIAVGVLRFEKSLPWDISKTSLDSFDWPLGRPKRLENSTVADMAETDHLVLMPEKWFWFKRFSSVKARISLAIPEPKAFQRNDYLLAAASGGRFYRIMTADPALEKKKSNARVFTFGTTWVPEWKDLKVEKDRNISLIASAKRYMKGHKLRHKCVDWVKENGIDVDIMGRGYRSFEKKSDGLARYRFSVVIENSREENYFTEKLLDAILCNTIPIYWGCPNISQFFDTDGMVICHSREEIQNAIQGANEELYQQKLFAFKYNKIKADYYGDYYGRLASFLLEQDQ